MRGRVLALLAVGALVACQEPAAGPSTTDFTRSRAELAKKSAERKAKGPGGSKQKVAKATPAKKTAASFGAVEQSFHYEPAGLRDPFRSFEWERLADAENAELQGPLERFDVSQLSLVAVVWSTGRPRAMVQDPAGQSYIVAQGSRIGKNDGRVIEIGDNSVMVKETYVDLLGQETTKDIEMRIRRSQGG